jgi:hypothetical protein
MKTLYVLTQIPAKNFGPDQPELQPGALLKNVPEAITDRLVDKGFARLATVAEIDGTADPVFWADEPETTVAAKKGKRVKVRLLSDSDYGKANTVVFMSAAEAKSAGEAGFADSTPEAVAYAESLLDAPVVDDQADAIDQDQSNDLSNLEVVPPQTEKVVEATAKAAKTNKR